MRVAIVHDWLYVLGGAERVLREMLRCYPQADIFALFDVLNDEERAWIGYRQATTSFLQRVPGIGMRHRTLLPMLPFAIEQLDVSKYDLVISSSSAVAKGVITGPHQLHISYVHSPMRYAWDLQEQYLAESRGPLGSKAALARVLLHRIRLWDTATGARPDVLIANSAYIARRIRKAFGRDAVVIHPPVEVNALSPPPARENHFLCAGRLVSYKNVKPVIEAFSLIPDLRLIVAGSGPDEQKLRAIAGANVIFAGRVEDAEMRRLMATARALIFAAEEDFGIVPVEAQAEGTPVIALGRGGARESIVASGPRPTGQFFDKPDATSIATAINAFIAREHAFSASACREQAQTFSALRFRRQFMRVVDLELARDRELILVPASQRMRNRGAAAAE